MTPTDWLQIVAWMCRLWPHSPIEPDTANAWWPFIANLDPDRTRHAIATLALEPGRRFPPGVGDIVTTAQHHEPRDWFQAWTDVYTAIAGTSGRVRYTGDDPHVTEFVSQLGEWREQVDEASPALRAQFRDYYRSAATQEQRQLREAVANEVVLQLGYDLQVPTIGTTDG